MRNAEFKVMVCYGDNIFFIWWWLGSTNKWQAVSATIHTTQGVPAETGSLALAISPAKARTQANERAG